MYYSRKYLPVTFLLDTGSNVTFVSKDLLEHLPSETSQYLQPTNIKMLTVTGEVAPFLIYLEIGSQKVQHNVLVVRIENDRILGMDFLTAHQRELILSQQYMNKNNEKI